MRRCPLFFPDTHLVKSPLLASQPPSWANSRLHVEPIRWRDGPETGFEEIGPFLSPSVYYRDHRQLNIPGG